jgi:thiamine pyrophosphate-dependent acetolactate synthase large subunit-like protein
MTGSMGLVASVGTGLALATGLVTVVVDGDGSLLMNPVGLIIAGAAQVPLLHLVLDDGQYAWTGGQPVPAGHTDSMRWRRLC